MKKNTFTREALSVAIPTMIAFLSDYTYQIIDAFWVAKLGKGMPTAVVAAGIALALFLSLNEIVGAGSIPVFSQTYSKNDNKVSSYVFFQGLMFKGTLGILCGIIYLIFIFNFAGIYTESKEVISNIRSYGSIIWLSLVFIMPYATAFTALRTIGYSRITMYISFVCTGLNIVLDPVLIYGFGEKAVEKFPLGDFLGAGSNSIFGFSLNSMGIRGAAIATIFTQLVCLVLALFFLIKNKKGIKIFKVEHLKFDMKIYRKMFFIGLPVGLIAFLWNSEQNYISSLIAEFGVNVTDGYSVSVRVRGAMVMAMFGLSIGAAIVSGKFIGEKRVKELVAEISKFTTYTIIIMGSISVPLFIFAEYFIKLFLTTPASVAVGVFFLRCFCVMEMIFLPSHILSCVFQGAGKNIPLLITNFIEMCLVEIPLLYVFVKIFGFDYKIIPMIIVSNIIIHLVVMTILFKKRLWLK